MIATVQKENSAQAETYNDVVKLIWHTVHRFAERYGGDREELFSRANEVFMETYEDFDASRSSYSTYLRRMIWWKLLEIRRTAARRHRLLPTVNFSAVEGERDGMGNFPDHSCSSFRRAEFLAELGEDAAAVVKLALEVPGELMGLVHSQRSQSASLRKMLVNHFRGLGWTIKRVAESFREIKETLK